MRDLMSTPRKNTSGSMRRWRVTIAAIFALGGAGIIAPPLLLGGHESVEWTVLPAAVRTFTPDWPGYDCRSIGDGWRTCAQHGYHTPAGRP